MNYYEALLLSFIEGLTEFLPISSTGHLILVSATLGIEEQGFVKSFNVIIQFGAIASVLVLYWRRFLPDLSFYKKVIIGFLPAAAIGLVLKSRIDAVLGSVTIVAIALILGGLVLIWSDSYFKNRVQRQTPMQDLSWKSCLVIGLFQCFAFIPGVSRSAASIIGGLFMGMNRKEAAACSFFLAVPTLAGASLIKSIPLLKTINSDQIGLLLFGTVCSFIFAMAAIQLFVNLITKYGFKHFGYYRIVVGGSVLILTLWGRP